MPTDPRIVENLRSRREHWLSEIRPLVTDRVAAATTPQDYRTIVDLLEERVKEQVDRIERGRSLGAVIAGESLARVRAIQLASIGSSFRLIGASYLIARGVIRRAQKLAGTAERVAAGELTLKAGLDGGDEISALGVAFDKMTETLRATIESERKRRSRSEKVIVGIRETVTGLSTATRRSWPARRSRPPAPRSRPPPCRRPSPPSTR